MAAYRYGVLLDNSCGSSLSLAVNKALGMFSDIHKGLQPSEVHFPPRSCPIQETLNGLSVHADERLRPGVIRVTTHPMTFADELEVEMQAFAQQVGQAAV